MFLNKKFACISCIFHTCHMPTNLLLFDPKIIFFWRVQILKFLIMVFSRIHSYFIPFRTKYFSRHLNLEHPQPTFFTSWERPSFTPMENNRKIMIPYITVFVFLGSRMEGKVFLTKWWQTLPELVLVLISSYIRWRFISSVSKNVERVTFFKGC